MCSIIIGIYANNMRDLRVTLNSSYIDTHSTKHIYLYIYIYIYIYKYVTGRWSLSRNYQHPCRDKES